MVSLGWPHGGEGDGEINGGPSENNDEVILLSVSCGTRRHHECSGGEWDGTSWRAEYSMWVQCRSRMILHRRTPALRSTAYTDCTLRWTLSSLRCSLHPSQMKPRRIAPRSRFWVRSDRRSRHSQPRVNASQQRSTQLNVVGNRPCTVSALHHSPQPRFSSAGTLMERVGCRLRTRC